MRDRPEGSIPRSPDGESALAAIDSLPYRRRVCEAMSAPAVTAPPGMTLQEAIRRMVAHQVSSVIVTACESNSPDPDRPLGIVTERDILRQMAEGGEAALRAPLSAVMSSPVATVPQDRFLYVAMGRMQRLGVRHLPVVDSAGAVVGLLTTRALLKQRAGPTLALGDEIATAADGTAMARSWARLPELAGRLLEDGMAATDIAAMISAVIHDMTARAGEIAAAELERDGHGAAPASWCLLLLGSAGRGESLLAADQDNALVHDGTEADDPWFAALGARVNDLLDQAGLSLCKGGVMARNAGWRRSLAAWQRQVEHWIGAATGADLLNVDIFYDFQPAIGDHVLADALRRHALAAARDRGFLRLMAGQLEDLGSPVGAFGRIRTRGGALDLKSSGLFPIVAAARIMALRQGLPATATMQRLAGVAAAGLVNPDDAAALSEAYAMILQAILLQQVKAIALGGTPGSMVDIRAMSRRDRRKLRDALSLAANVESLVRDALTR